MRAALVFVALLFLCTTVYLGVQLREARSTIERGGYDLCAKECPEYTQCMVELGRAQVDMKRLGESYVRCVRGDYGEER